jgi:hypothetical protein
MRLRRKCWWSGHLHVMRHRASFAGICALALCIGVLAWFVPAREVSRLMWLFVFVALVACCLFTWTRPNAPATPRGWLFFLACALVVSAVVAGTDLLVYGSSMALLELSIGLLAAFVAVAGLVRCLVLRRHNAA